LLVDLYLRRNSAQKNDRQVAMDLLNRYLQKHADDPGSLYNRGLLYGYGAKWEQARSDLEDALKSAAQRPDQQELMLQIYPRLALAYENLKTQNLEPAIRYLREMLTMLEAQNKQTQIQQIVEKLIRLYRLQSKGKSEEVRKLLGSYRTKYPESSYWA